MHFNHSVSEIYKDGNASFFDSNGSLVKGNFDLVIGADGAYSGNSETNSLISSFIIIDTFKF